MNRQTLIEQVATNTKETKAAAERSVTAVLEGIKFGLKKDKHVQLIGFGTFTVKNRKARTGRNPRTGEQIKIKASKTVGFKAGSDLKTSL
ncbi:MAG: HU family DNA-binding protein [Planctomycetes bacterium]|nr:HU family DNA-binding protein [Planctomycetota bacterium]